MKSDQSFSVRERPSIALALVHLEDAPQGGRARVDLALQVHRREDLESILEQPLIGVAGDQIAAHVLGHVGRGLARNIRHREHFDRRGRGLVVLALGDHSLLEHAADHVGAAALRCLGMGERRIARRRLRQARDQRHLGQRQLPDILAEVVLGRGLHAIAVVAQINFVQVEREDLLLGEVVLEAPGQDHLAQVAALACPAFADVGRGDAFNAGQDRFRRLLRERRSALHVAAEHEGLEGRAKEAAEADPGVIEEVGVLARDQRLD
jgi:hypothetical protein